MNTNIIEENKRLQEEARLWLERTRIESILSKYGEFNIEGSYAYGLMAEADIDMYVIMENPTRESVLNILNELIREIPFVAGYKFSDNVHFETPKEFPEGYMISLFTMENGTQWRFDVWFWTREQHEKIPSYPKLIRQNMDENKKKVILHFKDFLKKENLKIPSVKVYDAVLKDNVMTIDELREYLKR